MAEIHTFPARLNDEAIRRLTEQLSAAFAAGEDLGSRAPHIHALGVALERTLQGLDQELANLEDAMAPHYYNELLRITGVGIIRETLASLITQAQAFPVSR